MQNQGVAKGDYQLNVAVGDSIIFHFDFSIFHLTRNQTKVLLISRKRLAMKTSSPLPLQRLKEGLPKEKLISNTLACSNA